MPLEVASYISQLNTSNPTSTDPVSQADDHLRLIKEVLTNTFPNLSGAVTATSEDINKPVPKGLICLWSGALISVPVGWALCDGTGGTPDLRDKFVVGAGLAYAIGANGGALLTGSAGGHTHTELAAGSHNHGGTTSSGTVLVGTGVGTSVAQGISVDGSHTHDINAVTDHVHSVLPPYYSLAYIIKL